MLAKAADVISTNPWIVVGLALLSFGTYLKWYLNKQVKVAHWFAESAFYDDGDVKLASENASYFLSVILHNAGNFGFFAVNAVIFSVISNAVEIDFENTGGTIIGIVFFVLTTTMFGAALTIILLTSFFAQRVRKAIKESATKTKGK